MIKTLRDHSTRSWERGLLLMAILGLGAIGPTQADFETGVAAYYNRDYTRAFLEFRNAAEQGDLNAQYNIGFMYLKGQGVPKDDQEAVKWFRRAAEQGQPGAQAFLGALYADGQGVPQNYSTAAQWFRRAAEQGHAVAQYFLGQLYAEGRGVSQDYIQAYLWFSLSIAQGYKEAAIARDKITGLMTPIQLSEAERLAKDKTPN